MAKLKEVVEGDFRYNNMEDEAQKWLLKIPALKKRTQEGKRIKFTDLEQFIIQMQKKYPITMQWINLTLIDGEKPWYSVSIKDKKTGKWLKTIYGLTMYELYCKVALYIFACTREKE